MKKSYLHLLLITIVGILIYSNTLNSPLVFDDIPNIVENYKFKNLANLWPPSEARWFGFLTFALNYKLGGLNVTGYHVFNLVIHILNAILIYYLMVLTFKTPYFSPPFNSPLTKEEVRGVAPRSVEGHRGVALFSAFLFVSHPIQTQAVTYIVQRFTSLATFFYLLSFITYIRFRIQSSEKDKKSQISNLKTVFYYLSSVFCAILAMQTKEIAFTLPVMITFYEFMFFDGKIKKRILYLIPLFLTMLIIPLSLIGIEKPIGDAIGELRKATQETEEIPRWGYLFTQFRVMVTYIRLLFLPLNQNLDYDYPIYNSFFEPIVLLSFFFLLLIFGFGISLFYRSQVMVHSPQPSNLYLTPHSLRLTALGILWVFITLSVESSVIPIRDVIFEHRVYLPSVGISIAFISLTFYMLRFKIYDSLRSLITYCLLFVLIVFSLMTYHRNLVWQDKVTLWADVVKKSPNKARPRLSLGASYEEKDRLEEAIEEFQTALKFQPDYAEPHYNLGNIYSKQNRTNEAFMEYQTALMLNPSYVKAYYNLGIVYLNRNRLDAAVKEFQTVLHFNIENADAHNNLGNAYFKQGRIDEAIKEFQIALTLKPDDARIYHNLGNAYSKQGRIDEAIKEFQSALSFAPELEVTRNNLGVLYANKGLIDAAVKEFQTVLHFNIENADAHNNLGNAYSNQGRIVEAIKEFQIALTLKPDYDKVHYNLGVLYADQGRLKDAIQEYQAALKINPEHTDAHYNLGKIYFAHDRLDEAVREYRAVLKINPQDAEAHYNLGNVYSIQGRINEAIEEYQIALNLKPDFAEARNDLKAIYKEIKSNKK